MVANGGVVKAKLILDSSEFSSEWKKRIGELNARIRGPDFSGIKKELDDTGQAAKKTKENVDQINNSRFDKATSNLDELVRKVKSLQSSAKPLDIVVKPTNIDETIRKIRELGSQGKKAEEEVKQINNSRFDRLVSTLDGAINKMRSTSNSGVNSIKNSITSGINSITFTSLQNKFSATIQSMKSTASAGAKSIVNEFSGMEASLNDIFATVAGGAGLYEIFNYGMGRATTQAMLQNSKSPQDASTIMQQYQAYTVASSTQDTDIQRVLKYVIQGAQPGQTYRALSAIDAAAFTPDPVQRQELLRNYGQYLTNGYSAALFRGDVTAEEAQILQSAQTPEDRIAAMEQVAKGRGSMTETGENLSTLTTGPMANYNKALIITDTLMRGMTDGFNKFMDTISPIMDWFIALDPETQNFIGNLVFFAGVLGMAGGAVKILGSLFSPFISIFKTVGSGAIDVANKLKDMVPTDKITTVLGKLKDAAGNGISSMSDKVVEGLSGLKDRVSGPLSSFKDAVVGKFNDLKDWINNNWKPNPSTPQSTPTSTTTTPGTTPTQSPIVSTAKSLGTLGIIGALGTASGFGLQQFNKFLGGSHEGFMSLVNLAGIGAPGTGMANLLGGMLGGETVSPLDFATAGIPGLGLMRSSYNAWKGLGGLLPGTASAAGRSGGKSSIMDDIFGSKGILRGTPLAGLKWPTAGQILGKLMDVLLPKVPKLNWKAPNVTQILHGVWEKINPLNWKIPGVGQILGQTWERINPLNWKIPGVGDFLSQTWQKINPLNWQIPTVGDILGIIRGIIPPFSWPWGPGGGTRASNVAGDVASRASTLLSRGPPRGPLTSMVSDEISKRSGLGQGNIASAMSKRFKGISAFTDIANGMADHLGYEFYMGDQKSNRQVWDSGTCNCYDGAQFLMDEANRKMGLGGGLQNGLWDGTAIPHTWSVIGGQPFDMAAMLLRGQWAPPSGPNNMTVAQFMTDIGPGLEYMAYGGHLKDPIDAVFDGGNCFDTTLGLMGMINGLFGVPTEMVWGTYDGMSHVWLRAGGVDYDPTRRALANTYSPPPQGPGGNANSGGVHFHEGAIQLNGPFVGMEAYKKQIKDYARQAFDEEARREKIYQFGR